MTGMVEREAIRYWVVVRDPGCVPDAKGPFLHRMVPGFIRQCMAARPYSYIEVIWTGPSGYLQVEDGPQYLQMADARSAGVARRHIERLASLRLPIDQAST